MSNPVGIEFEKWRAQFDDDLPPPNRNYYGNWFYGLCEPNITILLRIASGI